MCIQIDGHLSNFSTANLSLSMPLATLFCRIRSVMMTVLHLAVVEPRDTTWYNTSSQNSLLQFILFFFFGHNTTAKIFKLSKLSKLFSCPCDSESECSEAPGVSMAQGTMFHHVFCMYIQICRLMPYFLRQH